MAKSESKVLREIREHFGAFPDRIVLWRNQVGLARHFDDKTGTFRKFPYGLCVGSADLVGLLIPSGRFIAIETKREKGGKLSDEQKVWGALVVRAGGIWVCARSVGDVLEVLEREAGW